MPTLSPKNVLVIRSCAIGDVLMSTPLIEALRSAWPDAKISYLVGKWSAGVLKNNPNIDNIIEFDDNLVVRKNVFGLLHLISILKKSQFDLCIVLDKSWLWSLFAKFTGAKIIVGFRRNHSIDLNTVSVPFSASKYELEYYLDIARKLGLEIKSTAMKIYATENDKKIASEYNTDNAVGIAPGGAQNPGQYLKAKRWPLKNYELLIKKLLEKNYNLILFGGKADAEICNGLANDVVVSVAGKTNIQQSYLLMKNCKYFITHDSGPMHIAAAAGLGKRLITIFGPTSPKRFAPPDATVLLPKSLPRNYNPDSDVYKPISPSKIEYATVDDVLNRIN